MLARSGTDLHRLEQVSPFSECMALLGRHRKLTWEMAKRELTERYTGQFLGSAWVVIHPLLMMAVYVFIFAYVLRVRFDSLPGNYAIYILSGLIPWMSFQDSMAKGCRYITSNASLVKQVVFPIEILPVKGVLTSFVNQMIATVFLLLYLGFSHHSIGWTMALLPLVIFFQLIAMVGVNFFLSSVSVYVRDLTNIVQVFSTIGLYIMPVFYPSAWMPEFLRPIHYLNPFSYLVWCYQDVMYFGRFEHWWAWCVFPALSLLMLVLGYRTFKTLRTMFANAL